MQSEQQEEKRILKQDRIRSRQDFSKCTNIQIIGVPEGEEEEIENLCEKITKENFLNLVKEIEVQEAQSPKQDGHKEDHTKAHYN